MNTPETRGLKGYKMSPWRLKAHMLYDTIRNASEQHAENEEYAVGLISDWLADAYQLGGEDQVARQFKIEGATPCPPQASRRHSEKQRRK